MSILEITAIFAISAASILWLVSLAIRDCSIIDIFWAPGFALLAFVTAWIAAPLDLRAQVTLVLVTIWALRLGMHIFVRWLPKGEDYRYAAMRRKHGPRWWWWSLFQVFWLQALLLWLISWPLQAAIMGAGEPLDVLDYVGVGIAIAGLLTEAVADWQLTLFRSNPANKDAVMDRGLWGWSRHPNYFGDALMWWGFFLLGLSATGEWVLILSPAVMTILLLRISGVALMEEAIAKRRPEYADYIARTSTFIPLPPKRSKRR